MIIKEYVNSVGNDILTSERMQIEKDLKQHGNISCYQHSINVACLSVRIAYKFNMKINYKSLVRGALLHDYFLYDWHDGDKSHRLHGLTHAKAALKNACTDFELNDIEKDIILKHMFPLNIKFPCFKETYIVSISDKICAVCEKFNAKLVQRASIKEVKIRAVESI